MEIEEAANLITGAIANGSTTQIWADLGCGSGTFTRALASLLPAGSTIHAIDRQPQSLPGQYKNTAIHFEKADFERDELKPTNLDGILLANALHYVRGQQAIIARLATRLQREGRFLLVEYDHRKANRWVPYPVPFTAATELFKSIGFNNIHKLDERLSAYGEATMYSCVASIV